MKLALVPGVRRRGRQRRFSPSPSRQWRRRHEGRDRRHRHPPVRPYAGRERPRPGRARRRAKRWPTRVWPGRTCSSPSAAATPPEMPTRSCRISALPACRSSTCGTAAGRGAARSSPAAARSCPASTTSGWSSASTSTHRARSTPILPRWASASGTAQTGLMLTTQFFAMKIQRYMHLHGISAGTLAAVASKAFRNGALNPNAWRREPQLAGGGRGVEDGQPSADAVHVLLARRGCGGARAQPRRPAPTATPTRRCSSRPPSSALGGSARFEVFSPWLSPESAPGPTVDAARAAFEAAGVASGRRRRRADPGHRGRCGDHAHGRDRAVQGRRARGADPRRRDRDRRPCCPSTPTADAWPTASRSARRVCARSTRTSCSCAVPPGPAQVPGHAAGRFQPRVRRAGDQRLHGADEMTAPPRSEVDAMTWGFETDPEFQARTGLGGRVRPHRDRPGRHARRSRVGRHRPAAQQADPPAAARSSRSESSGAATSARNSAAPATGR